MENILINFLLCYLFLLVMVLPKTVRADAACGPGYQCWAAETVSHHGCVPDGAKACALPKRVCATNASIDCSVAACVPYGNSCVDVCSVWNTSDTCNTYYGNAECTAGVNYCQGDYTVKDCKVEAVGGKCVETPSTKTAHCCYGVGATP